MNKYFLQLITLLVMVASCNNDNGGTAMETLPENDTTATVIDDHSSLSQPGLSAAELEDDKVFAEVSKASTWEVAGIRDVRGFKMFLKQVQQWVATDQKEELSKVILYPVLSGTIEDKKMFVENYDKVFDKELKDIVKSARLDQVFRNYRGAMIGEGKLWFAQMDDKFRIIAIKPSRLSDWGLVPPKTP